MENISIREAQSGDVEFLWTALYYASHSFKQDGVTIASIKTDPKLRRYVEGWGGSGDLGLIAATEAEDVGAAWVRPLPPEAHDEPTFVDAETPELAVAVLPDRQGHGIGTVLVQELIRLSRSRYPAIVLSVRSGNEAEHLYRRLGFRPVSSIRNRVGTESLMMILDLS